MGASKESLLEYYSSYDKRSGSNGDIFGFILICSLLFFVSVGIFLRVNRPVTESMEEKIAKIRTSFVIEEKKPVVKKTVPKPKPEKKEPPEKKEKEPVDLTKKPVTAQKQDDIVEPPKVPVKKTVRRVYGLRRVYSTGIGAGGDNADAVIGKLGNTLATEPDTFKATGEELVGEVKSITSVTKVPVLKVRVRPEYTKEMLEKRIEGVVRAKILVDADGRVKQVVILDDLGYGSKQKVYEACLKLVFEPSIDNTNTPVASWIIISFRFEITD